MKLTIKSEFVNDDWERLYFNEELVYENHSITARQLMELLEQQGIIKAEYTEVQEED